MVVCDQGSNNRKALASLGASKDNVKIFINGMEIYTCFDTPHLIKSLRNNFMNTKLKIVVDGNEVSWHDFVDTYKIDHKSNVTRAMLKITDTHVNPTTFQKMKVKYAVQVFSHSVAAAIATCAETGEVRSRTAKNTASFLKYINDTFDCLNSRVVKAANPYNCGLSTYNTFTTTRLAEALQYFQKIEIFENGRARNNIYCIEGFQWTIRAILGLWDSLVKDDYKYMLTSRINQDPLENFFSVIRNRNGYNAQPTVKQFRIALQHNMHIRLQAPVDGANCEVDADDILELYDNHDHPNNSTSKDYQREVYTSCNDNDLEVEYDCD
ncbi:uncharacterized protein LOC116175207 [Photinus pyralis]|nr:uncharacterized protein LOC116166935 [Photinus pyralis]XP_031349202.1 uncharacterized protein LOC116175207 [Photinus pyralis]